MGRTVHKADTFSTRGLKLWRKLIDLFDKIILIKQNDLSIKGQQFCDDVLFHFFFLKIRSIDAIGNYLLFQLIKTFYLTFFFYNIRRVFFEDF